jgi:cell division protein FtsW
MSAASISKTTSLDTLSARKREAALEHQTWPLDMHLLSATLVLLLIGVVMVYSASIASAEKQLGASTFYLQRHVVFCGIGFVAGFITYFLPTSFWQRTRVLSLFAVFILLGLVLVPGIGKMVNGSRRWIDLGFFTLQASELAKLGVIIFLSGYLVKQQKDVEQSFSAFLRPLFVVVLVCVLLMYEPDFGATAVMMGITMGMLFLGGVRITHFLFFVLSSIVALGYVALSSEYRVQRILSFLDPWEHSQDSGYQLVQSLIAIGRGEWMGVGLGNSMQKLFYLPEAHTDFVFAIFAEEFGLLGVFVLVSLFVFVLFRAFSIAKDAMRVHRPYQAYMASGLGLWIGLQALVNIGVNLGALPTKGLTLPFISYGGSNLITICIAIALLLRIHKETVIASTGTSSTKRKRVKTQWSEQ